MVVGTWPGKKKNRNRRTVSVICGFCCISERAETLLTNDVALKGRYKNGGEETVSVLRHFSELRRVSKSFDLFSLSVPLAQI